MDNRITRRTLLRTAAVAPLAASCRPSAEPTAMQTPTEMTPSTSRQPVVFLPHGGGPWPFMNEPMGGPGAWDQMEGYMRSLNMVPPTPPSAILVVSAHWEERAPTVQSAAAPPMLYDYRGFPPETYEIDWPAPGAPELAGEITAHLQRAGFAAALDAERGFDHGVFVPLMLAWPEHQVPTLQVSLKTGLDPAEHFSMGRALAPLRDQGVFIVGSGMSYHNLRALRTQMQGGPAPTDASRAFDDWLAEIAAADVSTRETALIEWESAPHARDCHPREEHLLPLHVCAGAAADDDATTPYRDVVMGAHVSAMHFG